LGDNDNVQAKGLLNSVFNIAGDGNGVSAIGVLNNGTNFFGNDNEVIAANDPDPTANILQQIGLNVAFNTFGDGNIVHAGSQIAPPPGGPLAIAGAIGVTNRTFSQQGFGVTLATPFNDTGIPPTNVLAASSTQGNRARVNSTGGNTNVP